MTAEQLREIQGYLDAFEQLNHGPGRECCYECEPVAWRGGLETSLEHLVPGDWWNDRVTFAASKGDTHNIWSVGLSQRSLKFEGDPERVTVGSSIDDAPRKGVLHPRYSWVVRAVPACPL